MVDIRQLLAVVLGVLFGLVLLAAPRAALKLSVLSGPQGRRRDGEWGADDPVPAWLVWVVRALGLACLGVAAFIAV
jgi:hypothetical protein